MYQDFADVYDELMDQVPYDRWCENILGFIRSLGISEPVRDSSDPLTAERNTVIDLGCGTGTLTGMLYEAGYDVMGIDMSEAMLERAMEKSRKKGQPILYLCQDMRELELYGTAGTIISVCDCVNYILEKEELLQVFKRVNNYLYPGGLFIFDFNTAVKYETIGDCVIAENREDCSFIWENTYYEDEHINEYDLTVFVKQEGEAFRRFRENHLQRGYSPKEMKKLVEQAGLRVLEVLDADRLQPAGEDCQRAYILAREALKADTHTCK